MARYEYQCEKCGRTEQFEIPMDTPKDPRPCVMCWGMMVRTFQPTHHRHVNAKGEPIRAPGSEWRGGDRFSMARFKAENPNYGKRARG